MSSSDAIVIGEDWISEHYFTTDAGKQSFQGQVQQFRKDWDAATTETVRSRFTAARRDLESALADLMSGEGASNGGSLAAASDLYATLRRVLGYAAPEYALTAVGPVIAVRAPGITEAAPLVIVEARPVDAVDDLLARDADTLLTGYPVDDKTTLTSTARLLSTLFVDPEGPDFALVLAGRWALVAERERWAEGRYLAVDLQLVCERNDPKRGGEIDRALACLSAESLAPDADGAVWWAGVLAQSIKHTVGVSADLREGVRLSIEIIANEVVDRRRAQQLDPLPQAQAQPLAKQALRFLYRILFLLYAEASPELGVLPVGETEYEQGYGLDRLRDLTLAELASPKSRGGTHLYESLATLFRLVDRGHAAPATGADGVLKGLTFSGLKADLFHPAATALIDEVGLGNAAVQKVLRKLLLSKESRGRDRGFISYAELGINQLGAVYEGLMSYTGFFAETDLYEVAKNGDAAKGSWVVPIERAEGIAEADFVREIDGVTGESRAVLHRRGTFVFRLAGRERQQSASYYTPEVLTRFTVSQALAELLDQDGHTTTAEEILGLSVCEPALGSGAFAIEAVRQLAEEYLRRRQSELGTRIDPDAYAVAEPSAHLSHPASDRAARMALRSFVARLGGIHVRTRHRNPFTTSSVSSRSTPNRPTSRAPPGRRVIDESTTSPTRDQNNLPAPPNTTPILPRDPAQASLSPTICWTAPPDDDHPDEYAIAPHRTARVARRGNCRRGAQTRPPPRRGPIARDSTSLLTPTLHPLPTASVLLPPPRTSANAARRRRRPRAPPRLPGRPRPQVHHCRHLALGRAPSPSGRWCSRARPDPGGCRKPRTASDSRILTAASRRGAAGVVRASTGQPDPGAGDGRCGIRGREPARAMPRADPLRHPVEPDPHRAAQRAHRPVRSRSTPRRSPPCCSTHRPLLRRPRGYADRRSTRPTRPGDVAR